MKYIVPLLILNSFAVAGDWTFEPSIQCTVVKVHSNIAILGFNSFPKLYQSINNDPITSKL